MRNTMKCKKCGKATKKGKNRFTFSFRGAKVSDYSASDICAGCFKKGGVAELMEWVNGGYLSVAAGAVKVNWRKVKQLEINSGRSGSSDYEILLGWLVKLNVLSFETDGRYMVQKGGSQICFHIFGNELYFVEKEDAEKFIASLESSSSSKILLLKDA